MPSHERQVRIRALIPDQIPRPLLLEMRIQHPNHALHLIDVALHSGGDLFGVVALEPHALAVVGALAGDLEVQPLVAEVFFGGGGVADRVVLVVGFDEVLVDGTGFPEGDVGVRVGDGWDAAVGAYFRDVGGLDVRIRCVGHVGVGRMLWMAEREGP
jgi:hypothetical protein